MTEYKVILMRGVDEELATVEEASYERVTATLSALSLNPDIGMRGLAHIFVDISGYRITYVVQDETQTVVVGRIFKLSPKTDSQ